MNVSDRMLNRLKARAEGLLESDEMTRVAIKTQSHGNRGDCFTRRRAGIRNADGRHDVPVTQSPPENIFTGLAHNLLRRIRRGPTARREPSPL